MPLWFVRLFFSRNSLSYPTNFFNIHPNIDLAPFANMIKYAQPHRHRPAAVIRSLVTILYFLKSTGCSVGLFNSPKTAISIPTPPSKFRSLLSSEGPPWRYRIYLKSYALHNDTLELLKTLLLQDLKPTTVFDQGGIWD